MTRAAMNRAPLVVAVWTAGQQALADTLGDQRVRLVLNGVDTCAVHPGRAGTR